jgi:hypothetical protein
LQQTRKAIDYAATSLTRVSIEQAIEIFCPGGIQSPRASP